MNKIPRKKNFFKNVFTKKVQKIVSMGYTGKLLKKLEKKFHNKSFPKRIIPKIVSMGDTGKLLKNKTKNHEKKLYKKSSSEKKSQRSYQWGTKESN